MKLFTPANMCANVLRQDLNAFTHRAFLELFPQEPFYPNWHHEVVAAQLEEDRRSGGKRIAFALPPRHLKSFMASVVYPAWLLGHDPTMQIMCVSHGQDLADKFARHSRTLMMRPFYQDLFDTRISQGRDAVSEFETTKGGFRYSTSIGGGPTGYGAHRIIVDDALRADDALSDVRRKSVNEVFDNTLRTRLNNRKNGSIIIVQQRLHVDDLIAHVQKYELWDVLAFPAIAEHDESYDFLTPYGRKRVQRKAGEALHPALMSLQELETQRRAMTEYNFAAQYLQNPAPLTGNIVQRDMLKFFTEAEMPERFDLIIQSWDTAVKNTELADYSVCTTWGIKGKHMYLLDVFRAKLEFPALKWNVRALAEQYKATVVLIEDKSSGSSLIQQLRAENFDIVQAAPALDGDKVMRLRAQTAKFAGGFVLLRASAPWLDTYLQELLSFPSCTYYDQVDSTVYALEWSTLNTSAYGWTDESNAGLQRVVQGVVDHIRFMRHAGCPWY
ncbi:MAG TPA: phage terminase large subunit [Xanthobacteraceae bacterium]|nr:phage terminase large subunit [Xanthobacteraceae bacterium]